MVAPLVDEDLPALLLTGWNQAVASILELDLDLISCLFLLAI